MNFDLFDELPFKGHGLFLPRRTFIKPGRYPIPDKPFKFLQLPAECRNQIVKELMRLHGYFSTPRPLLRLENFELLPLAMVNKQLREETLKLFMIENSWVAQVGARMKTGVEKPRRPLLYAAVNAALFRDVRFHFDEVPARFTCTDDVYHLHLTHFHCIIHVRVHPRIDPRVSFSHSLFWFLPEARWRFRPFKHCFLDKTMETMLADANAYVNELVDREGFEGLSAADLDGIANQLAIDVKVNVSMRELGTGMAPDFPRCTCCWHPISLVWSIEGNCRFCGINYLTARVSTTNPR